MQLCRDLRPRMTGSIRQGGSSARLLSDGRFFVCDIFGAVPKDDMATMEHPVFSLSTRPDLRVLNYLHNGMQFRVVPSVKGLATIHDKDPYLLRQSADGSAE